MNLFTTMVLGGLWHRAGWNFVIWGALHGAFLIINHAWQDINLRVFHSLVASAQTPDRHPRHIHLRRFCMGLFPGTGPRNRPSPDCGHARPAGGPNPEPILSRLGPLGDILGKLGVSSYLGGGARRGNLAVG